MMLLLRKPLRLYPGGVAWLRRRLDDAAHDKAICTVALVDNCVIGAAIETPKGIGTTKLSTLYMHPWYRFRGIGNKLLKHCVATWLRREQQLVYVTVPSCREVVIGGSLHKVGFDLLDVERERYGPLRDEMVYVWRPASTCLVM